MFVLAFAFAEGAGNDWISVAVIDDHGAAAAVGTLAFAAFLTAMTAGRWFGPWLLDRYGRVPVIRALDRRRGRRARAVLVRAEHAGGVRRRAAVGRSACRSASRSA